jgi:hypothetical protein
MYLLRSSIFFHPHFSILPQHGFSQFHYLIMQIAGANLL